MSSARRKSREAALQIMYHLEHGTEPEEAILNYFSHFALSKDGQEFSASLVHGTFSHLQAINQKIQDHSHKWRLDRMALVDRNILRLAVFELFFDTEKNPKKAILNEWIEVAKRFGAKDSKAFVNGILDSML